MARAHKRKGDTMYQAMQIRIRGVAPLVMHNGRLADPMDPFSREIKRLSGANRGANKTDEKSLVLSTVEWCGGLYHSDGAIEIADGEVTWGAGIRPHIPADLLKACIVAGATRSRLGKQAKAGVLIPDAGRLLYNGPADVNDLMRNPRFIYRKSAAVQRARVMRTRPIFREWECEFIAEINSEVLDDERVIEALTQAGRYCGIGDWRPEHGRFEVVA